MPIVTDDFGTPLVILGEGDVGVCTAKCLSEGVERELLLVQGTPHAIGESANDEVGKKSTDFPAAVRIRFEKPESLVVFIHQSVALLNRMMGNAE